MDPTTEEDPSVPGFSLDQPPPLFEDVFDAERILKERRVRGRLEYFMKWKGYPDSENSWEPAKNIIDPRLIAEWQDQKAAMKEVKKQLGVTGKKRGRKSSKESEKSSEETIKEILPGKIFSRSTNNSLSTLEDLDDSKFSSQQEKMDLLGRKSNNNKRSRSSDEKVPIGTMKGKSLLVKKTSAKKPKVEEEEEEDVEEEEENLNVITTGKSTMRRNSAPTSASLIKEDYQPTVSPTSPHHQPTTQPSTHPNPPSHPSQSVDEQNKENRGLVIHPPTSHPPRPQIFEMDVTVKGLTCTIREASTPIGFFKVDYYENGSSAAVATPTDNKRV